MKYPLPNLKSAIKRQTKLGHLFIIFLAIWVIFPYTLDKYRGEPTISTKIFTYVENNDVFLHEDISVRYPNRGSRNNIMYDINGRIVCVKNLVSYWEQSITRHWHISAFVGCDIPDFPFRICTIFSITSRSGIERKFGAGNEFCTSMYYPRTENRKL